ncbi:hypothetical protein ACFLVR_00655 [Chloroflexota bacterium]
MPGFHFKDYHPPACTCWECEDRSRSFSTYKTQKEIAEERQLEADKERGEPKPKHSAEEKQSVACRLSQNHYQFYDSVII